jgi:hypothetical protein
MCKTLTITIVVEVPSDYPMPSAISSCLQILSTGEDLVCKAGLEIYSAELLNDYGEDLA